MKTARVIGYVVGAYAVAAVTILVVAKNNTKFANFMDDSYERFGMGRPYEEGKV